MIEPYYSEEGVTLFCAKCEDVLPQLIERVDLVLTDPPYNLGREYDGNVNDNREDYEAWCVGWFSQLQRFQCPIVLSVGLKNVPMWFRIKPPSWQYCWFKNNNMGSGSEFTNIGVWEPFLIYGKPKRLGVDGTYIPVVPQVDAGWHDCPKPLKLMARLINDLSEGEQTILDPFVGSGTTLLAAKRTGRKAIGIEQSEDYCRRIVERLGQHELKFD
jgi:site-specific DNA-methyltransferase (adenine-specific)